MNRRLWTNLSLLAVVAALGLLAYFVPQEGDAEFALSTLNAVDITRIRIEARGAEPIEIDRTVNEWQIVAPLKARADVFQVQRLLGILGAKSKDRVAAAGLARYDLSQPALRLTLNQQTFAFGAINEMTRQQYVMSNEYVYLLPLNFAALPKDVMQLVSKQLFSAGESPVVFEFKDFSVIERDGKWQLNPGADLSADDISRWVEGWRLASAISVLPSGDRKALATVSVELRDGNHITLSVLQREPSLVLARSDQKFEYQYSSAVAQRLMSPPSAPAAPKQN